MRRLKNIFWKSVLCSMLLLILVLSGNAVDTITINSLEDNEGSDTVITLRKAINIANAKKVAIFDFGGKTGTILLKSDLPAINANTMAIYGTAGGDLKIDGDGKYRAFSILGGNVYIDDLVITHTFAKGGNGGNSGLSAAGAGGGGGMGSAVFLYKGLVTCTSCFFVENKVQGGNGGVSAGKGYSASGGGFSGDGKTVPQYSLYSVGGGSGGILGSSGEGGRAGANDGTMPGNGGFGGGGAGGTLYSYEDSNLTIIGASGGFGGGGGGCLYPGARGQGGLFAGNGDLWLGGGGAGLGGAVFARENTSLILKWCHFTGNVATHGNGNLITGNLYSRSGDGQGKGGAVFAMDGARVTAVGLHFSNNTADDAADKDLEYNDSFIGRKLDTNDFYGVFNSDDGSSAFPPSAASNWENY